MISVKATSQVRLLAGMMSVFALLALGMAIDAAGAPAENRIIDFKVTPSTNQAGGHPTMEVFINTRNQDTEELQPECGCADPRNIIVDMPAGVIADPHALPQCDDADFAANNCPIESQIGLIRIGFDNETAPIQPLQAPPPRR